jgi:hypothetical protein
MRHPDGSAAANVRAAAVRELADQYAEALRDYTREGAEDTLAWAFQLGQRAVDHGLGMREMAAMHEKGLLEALLEATVAADNATRIVELASDFQAVALAPFEKRHHRQVDEHATLSKLNLGLEQWLNATQHKLDAAQTQLRDARKADLRRNGCLLALGREMHGALNMLKGLLGADLDLNARRLLDEAIHNSERVTRLVTEWMDAHSAESGVASLSAVPAAPVAVSSASGSSS